MPGCWHKTWRDACQLYLMAAGECMGIDAGLTVHICWNDKDEDDRRYV